jgi:dienelactone hydrolase
MPRRAHMTISKYNHEGYHDPTAYEALSKMSKNHFRPIVYVCSPYAGDVERNTANTRRYCRFVVDRGCIPIAPHLLFPQFMQEDEERDLALFMDIVLLTKCAELWVFGDIITKGMELEIARAQRRDQPIRYFTNDFEEVHQ